MHRSMRRFLFWSPRILAIVFSMFLSIFAFDVLGEGYGFWKTIAALLIHLTPVYAVLIVLAIAWRWEWVGAILFFGLSIFYLVWSWGKFHWSVYLVISGPLALIGILFLLNSFNKAELSLR